LTTNSQSGNLPKLNPNLRKATENLLSSLPHMSQNTSVESSTPTSSHSSINSALQAALSSLDVQLEEELTRYRRQRAGRPVMSPRGLGRHQARKPLELIAVDKAGKKTPPALGMSTAPQISFPLGMMNQTPMAAPSEVEANSELKNPPSSATSSTASLVAPSPTNAPSEAASQPLVPTEKPTEVGGGLVPLTNAQAQPEDYLESSEQLLRSLAEQEVETAPKKRFTDRLLSPLSVGSILLLLLSSATLVFIFRNPSTVSALNPKRFFGTKTATPAKNPTDTTKVNNTPVPEKPALQGPNLASGELSQEVNLGTLSRLEPSPTLSAVPAQPELPSNPGGTVQAPSTVPNSALPPAGGSSDVSSALLPSPGQPGTTSSKLPPIAPLPPASAPQANQSHSSGTKTKPSSAPAKPAATQSANPKPKAESSVAGGLYYVLVNYSSDRDLEQVKKVVPDAYVETFPQGAKIQTGAFDRESQAKTLVEELKRQGITASIYRP